jgi:large subunit ribosomal protein L5
MNPMKSIRVGKVTLNIGFKDAAEIEKGKKLLSSLTTRKVVVTKARKRSTFGPTKGRPLGVMVTLRGKEALELLGRLLDAKERKIKESSFDQTGNFSFGVEECINIPGIKYDPDIGIIGMDVCVNLERPGYRVSRRKLRQAKIGKSHKINKEEALDFAKRELGVKVVKEG